MKPHREKEDVLIHYDEESGDVVFYAVPSSRTASLRQSSFDGIRPNVEEMRALPATEAMRRVGGTVLALLDLSSTEKLGITEEFMARANDDDL